MALKSEAQAFVDKYKLKKSKINKFIIYSNDKMLIIISGIGIPYARKATQTLINTFDINDNDIYLNIGICGANREYKVGDLIEIGSITHNNSTYTFKDAKNINCLDKESCDMSCKIVDMESYGFYDAIIHSPAIKKIYILKVVSDNFEPHKITKEQTKTLIFNKIDVINNIIFNKEKI